MTQPIAMSVQNLSVQVAESGETVAESARWVASGTDWLSADGHDRQQATRARVMAGQADPSVSSWKAPLSPLWPLGWFLVAAGALWWERKRDSA